MAIEQTLSIIKPDGVRKHKIGEIIKRFEDNGLNPVHMKMLHLSREQAEGFYAVHRERPFFSSLVDFMTSGRILVMTLEGENAILRNREIMGATNPENAAEGTIRRDFADNTEQNIVHGSDAVETAAVEIKFFFGE